MSDNMESGEKLIKLIRRLCELFRGRFTEQQSQQILKRYNYDVQEAASFLTNATPEERRNKFGKTFKEVEFVQRDEVLKDLARRNVVGWERRQFVCQPCGHHPWWRRVPKRKPVSKCNKCMVRYDPILRDQEFGWGKFVCRNCENNFSGFAVMDLGILYTGQTGKSQNYCFKCNHICEPVEILPPCKRSKHPRNRHTHSCSAENCFNRHRHTVQRGEMIIQICVHPRSNPKKAPGFGSKVHKSTGSTVDTFLTQDDDDTIAISDFQLSLDDIPECDSDNDNDA